ncbi:MAG: hypothetical protein ACP59X_10385 [Solidesulfovibrio sp. DCME]|uniref:hypothetical protein n=1 Tax=Solidesulfovibrio sp. DCME TaxID=3447380 RepID=UPI003D150493
MCSKDSIRLQALISISLKAIDKKDYRLCIVASNHILKINPVHTQALTLKCIGLYQSGNYRLSLSNLKYMLNNFDQKEVTTLENTMRQNNILPDTIHIQLMDELSKEIKRKQYVKNAINLGELFAVLQL